jgi:hypothetical protein
LTTQLDIRDAAESENYTGQVGGSGGSGAMTVAEIEAERKFKERFLKWEQKRSKQRMEEKDKTWEEAVR